MSEDRLTHQYIHTVQYYETDAMRIVHHSNYIRWMEEARLDFFAKHGLTYAKIEEMGIIIPVVGASCKYKAVTTYGEQVCISAELEQFTGVKFSVTYRITNLDGTVLHAIGRTEHGFLDNNMRPINIKKTAPQLYEIFAPYRT